VRPVGRVVELEQAEILAPLVERVDGVTLIAEFRVPAVPVELEYERLGTPTTALNETEAVVDPAELVAVIV